MYNPSFGGGRPFTPTPVRGRRRQSDREFVSFVANRAARQRMTTVEASEHLGQNADLGRRWRDARDRGQRRAIGNARVDRMLRDAAAATTSRVRAGP